MAELNKVSVGAGVLLGGIGGSRGLQCSDEGRRYHK